MVKVLRYSLPSVVVLLVFLLFSCREGLDDRQARQVKGMLEEAVRMTGMSRYEDAIELAVDALKVSGSGMGADRKLMAESHLTLSRIFLQATRDSLSWEHAVLAEGIATQIKNDSLLASALLLKGMVCSYSTFSKESNRDDEGIGYLDRAFRLSEKGGWDAISAEACYFLCESYVNKNRWNDILDKDLYAKAGDWLRKGEELDRNQPSSRSLSTRMRYLRQGDRTDEAIEFCQRVLASTPETDYLRVYQMYDHLTVLYLRKNEVAKGMEAHQNSSYYMQMYMRQKSDDILQEIETKYRTELKDRQIKSRTHLSAFLGLLLALSVGAIIMFIRLNQQISRQNKSIKSISRSREMLFAVIAKDLSDPAVSGVQDSQILDFFRKWPMMGEEEIKERCASLSIGDDPLDPLVVKYISDLMLSRKKSLDNKGLSPREVEIITLSKEGLSDKQIADRLCVSPRTVSNHKYHIYGKLEVSGNAEMLAKAEELGL